MNVTDKIIDDMGRRMAEDIDREMLWSMLVETGWTRVVISSETAMINATAIKDWLAVNCQGACEKNYSDFIFEQEKDASMFILRWV